MLSGKSIKLIFLLLNFIFLLFSLTFIIVGIHNILDHGLMLEITNGSIYLTGTYIMIFVGIILTFTIFIGLYGIFKENRFILIAFIVLLVILFIFTFIGGILILALPSSINSSAMSEMRTTLINQYARVRLITDAWNLTQSKLRCCGVDDGSWNIYMDSYWDNITNIDLINMNLKIAKQSPFYQFLPVSCCWALVDTQTGWPSSTIKNLGQCQNFQFGPPNFMNGAHNDAIYYRGCANALKSFLGMYGRGLGGLSIFLLFLYIPGIILAIIELRYIQKKPNREDRLNNEKPVASQLYSEEEKEAFNPSGSDVSI